MAMEVLVKMKMPVACSLQIGRFCFHVLVMVYKGFVLNHKSVRLLQQKHATARHDTDKGILSMKEKIFTFNHKITCFINRKSEEKNHIIPIL